MRSFFKNVQPAIKEETKRLAISMTVGVLLMFAAFFVLHRMMPEKVPFDYTVILGGVLGGCIAVLNFFLMGLTVQEVVTIKEEERARARMKASYTYRMMMQMLWVILAIVLPFIQMVAGIVPLFISGIWFKILGIMQNRSNKN